MTPNSTTKVSARERARQATAARLAEEQSRIKSNQDDLAQFFKAEESIEKVRSDSEARIARIREETNERVTHDDAKRAAALLALKTRGETVNSIAVMTGLTTVEVNKLLKAARSASTAKKETKTSADGSSADESDIDPAARADKSSTPETGESIDGDAPPSALAS